MERKKLWKRGLSAVLATLMIVTTALSPLPEGLFSIIASAAEKTFPVSESELALGINVIPKALSESKTFMDSYVRRGGMSMNGYFNYYSHRNSNKTGGKLSYTDKMMHKKKGDIWNVTFRWSNVSEKQRQLLKDKSYDFRYEGNVISEKHDRSFVSSKGINVYYNKHNGWDKAEVGLKDSSGIKWVGQSQLVDSGKAQSVHWSSDSFEFYGTYLEFYAKSLLCKCGESAASGNVFYMVDTTIPYITDTYICTDYDNPTESKLGNGQGVAVSSAVTNYIVLEFSEKVRFSDNAGKEISLNLDAYDRKNGVALDTGMMKAKLKSFSDNRMIFEYTVPSTINGKATDIYITGISSTQQELNGSFPLNLYHDNGSKANTGDQKSPCYITDIAGNGLDWSASDKSTGKVYYDNIAPTLTNVTMNGNMITETGLKSTDGIDRGSRFAGAGDWVEFVLSFSENINIHANSDMKMVLNLKGADGNYIKLDCNKDGGNRIKSVRLNFTEGLLKDGKLSEIMDGDQLCITGIEGITGITDSYGNTMKKESNYTATLSTITLKPAQQISVDLDAPVITTNLTPDADGVYTPTASTSSKEAEEKEDYFTFPITISEDITRTAFENTSQIEPQTAGFAIVQKLEEGEEGMKFGWYVDYEPSVNPENFKQGVAVSEETARYTYTPVNGETAYLHVKPDKSSKNGYRLKDENGEVVALVDAEIYVKACDNAGNTADMVFPIIHQLDSFEPEGRMENNVVKKVDYKELKSYITTDFSVKDDFGINEIQYYWTYTTTNENGVEETKTTAIEKIDLTSSLSKEYQQDVTLKIPFYENNDYGREGSAFLTVSYKDYAGYSGTMVSDTFTYNYTKAKSVYAVNGGTKSNPLYAPEVYLSAPVTENEAVTSETFLFIPYGTNEEGTTNYYIYQPREYDDTLDLIAEAIGLPKEEYISKSSVSKGQWYTAKGSIVDGGGSFTEIWKFDSNDFKEMREYFYGYKNANVGAFLEGIYGEQELLLITSSNFKTLESGYLGYEETFTAQESTVESVITNLANNATYTAKITGLRDDENADATGKYCYDVNNTAGNMTAKDLDGLEIELTLINNTPSEETVSYGLQLLDCEASNVELLYYGDYDRVGYSYGAESVYTWKLEKVWKQSLVVPENVATKSGWYGIRVNLILRDGTAMDSIVMDQYYLMDAFISDISMDSYVKEYTKYYDNGNVCKRITAENETKEEWGENPELEIALDKNPGENWSVDCNFTFSRNTRNYTEKSYGIQENVKVRVYNKNDENYDTNAIWINVNDVSSLQYEPVAVEEITAESYGTPEQLMIPLFDGDNLICYEIVNTNGVTNSYDVPIHVYAKCEEWDLKVENTRISERTGGVMEVTVSPMVSENIDLENSQFNYVETNGGETATSYTFVNDFEYEFWLLDQNGNLSTKTGKAEDVDGVAPAYVGFTSHSLGEGDTDGFYHFFVYAYDYKNAISADELMLTFDADYSAVLMGLTGEDRINNTEQITMKVPINREKDENGEYLPWESFEPGNNGIFRTKLEKEGPEEYEIDGTTSVYPGYISVEIWGTWKYDKDADPNVNPDGYSQYVNADKRILTFSVMDANGNVQQGSRKYPEGYRPYRNYNYELMVAEFYADGSMIPSWDEETGQSLPLLDKNGQLGVYSYVPLSKIYSYGAGKMQEVQTDWPGDTYLYTTLPMITEDGEYTIELMDLFGERYERRLLVSVFDSIGIDVGFSETEYTNQPVTVNVAATLENDEIISISANTTSASVGDNDTIMGTIDESDPSKAAITLKENGTITVETRLGKKRVIPVSNIDTRLEPVTITFVDYLGNEITGTETALDMEVTAMVYCEEEIEGIEGELKYTFPRGSKAGDTYTFVYRDMAGNEGTIQAHLPWDISEKEQGEEFTDVTAPTFDMFIYGLRNNKYQLITEVTDPGNMYVEEGESAITNEQFVELLTGAEGVLTGFVSQGYKFVLKITDETATKIIVQETGTAAPTSYEAAETGSTVENVTIENGTISVTDNSKEGKTFDIYIIDEFDNVTGITGIGITSIDKEAPKYTVNYVVSEDKKSVQAIFVPEETEDPMEPVYPLNKTMDYIEIPSGEVDENGEPCQVKRYFYQFTDNGEKIFYYQDECGNRGTVKASVQGISTQAAKVTSVLWTGTADGNAPTATSRNVNKDITANLNLSKAVSDVKLYLYDEGTENNKGASLADSTSVKVSFTGKTAVVTYTANMESIVAELVASESGNKTYYTLPAVKCIDKEAPQITVTGTEIAANKRSMKIIFETSEKTAIYENGKRLFGTTHTWSVRDNKEKVLHFADEAGNITEYKVTENSVIDMENLTAVYSATESHQDETTNPAKDFRLEAGDAIWVKTSKNATITIGSVQNNVNADTWNRLVLPETEGVYMLTLTDSNTGEVSYKTLSVQLKDQLPPVITLETKTIVLEEAITMEEMLAQIQSGIRIKDNKDGEISDFEVTGYPQSIEPGLHQLTYTTRDMAGNAATAERTLYIMKEGMTILYVNGLPALPFGRTIIEGYDLNFMTDSFGDEELLTMKIRSGIKSIGQMKRYTTTIEGMKTTVSAGGFYTVYVRTQDRSEYITYLYVEE